MKYLPNKFQVAITNEAHLNAVLAEIERKGFTGTMNAHDRSIVRAVQVGHFDPEDVSWDRGILDTGMYGKVLTTEELFSLDRRRKLKTLKLNENHTATIDPQERVVHVGCQTFSFSKIKELKFLVESELINYEQDNA